MHRLRVLRVSGASGGAAAALATALAASDVDVRVISAVEGPDPQVPPGLARRLQPLSVSTPTGEVQVPYFEGRLPGGGVDVAIAQCDASLLPAFALELCRASNQWPHVVHASADTAAVVPLAKRAPVPPVAIVDLNAGPPAVDPTLAGALEAADRITVSSASASEDARLAGFADRVCSIAPGIDDAVWNPLRDTHLPARFSANDLDGKVECKRSLQLELGLAVRARVPVIGVLGDALLLTDEREAEIAKLSCQIARDRGDEALRHRIAAGADFVLVAGPLGDDGYHPLFFMHYGAVPIAPRGARFAESLVDVHEPTRSGNAFLFAGGGEGLAAAVRRATASYRRAAHPQLVRRAMAHDLSWETAALRYQELYRQALLA